MHEKQTTEDRINRQARDWIIQASMPTQSNHLQNSLSMPSQRVIEASSKNEEEGLRVLLTGHEMMDMPPILPLAKGREEAMEFYNEAESAKLVLPSVTKERYDPDIECVINGIKTSSFPDMGAGANYMSKAFADSHGIRVNKRGAGVLKVANGRQSRTLGTAQLPLSFKNEEESHSLEFNVVPMCIRDVILGAPFLRLTRIARRIRDALSCRVRYIGAPQQRMSGMLNGKYVSTLPDTGSDISLISTAYAKGLGMAIKTSRRHRKRLEFADGSFAYTRGVVENLDWQYISSLGQSYASDFCVLDDLECDVLLSYDFLCDTDAFNRQQDSLEEFDEADMYDGDWSLSTITLREDLSQAWRKLKFPFQRPES